MGDIGLAYSIYGLQVLSNVPIPGLVESLVRSEADLEIWFGSVPNWALRIAGISTAAVIH